ncbi:hypothetical protein [Aromatoleum aromaticum]|uniref:hypothetical protein n=1 Tax=Aromatoleum aromaticum TaxID=551760 RepID=UPI00059FC1AF|nr:hypothetical protein [Aromatoleum aromaticum]
MRMLLAITFCLSLLGCVKTPDVTMAQCENEAQKITVGMVSNDPGLRSQLEEQRAELIRSCMASNGFKFNVGKYQSDITKIPLDQWVDFKKSAITKSSYWE